MTEAELQQKCDEGAKLIIETIGHLPSMLLLIALTGALGAYAYALGVSRKNTMDALNSVSDDIEQGEIPGKTSNSE